MASTGLSKTFSSSPTNNKKGTISFWMKRSGLGAYQIGPSVAGAGGGNCGLQFGSDDRLYMYLAYDGSTWHGEFLTNRKFRDTNAWYHIVIAWDTTQSTSTDRMKLYVNGVQETSLSTANYPDLNRATTFGNATAHYINYWSNGAYFNGVMSHLHYTDGYTYAASDFGSTDATTGAWKINTAPSVTYGTNGYFILKDGNSVTDQSGQSNNWSVATGTLTKTEDNPSNIFATWNPLWSASNGNVGDVAFSHGNLTTTTSSSYRTTPTTLGMSGTGKYYWEVKRIETNDGDVHFGVMSENATPANTATWIGNAANGWVLAGDSGQPYTGGTGGSALANGLVDDTGDIFMGAYDCATGKLYFGSNGTWAGTANPSTGANPHYTLDTSLTYFPVVSTGSDVSANFGNGYFGTSAVSSAGTNASNIGIFEYDVPTGFTALSTKGINSF